MGFRTTLHQAHQASKANQRRVLLQDLYPRSNESGLKRVTDTLAVSTRRDGRGHHAETNHFSVTIVGGR